LNNPEGVNKTEYTSFSREAIIQIPLHCAIGHTTY
jgi:hypothetical protein